MLALAPASDKIFTTHRSWLFTGSVSWAIWMIELCQCITVACEIICERRAWIYTKTEEMQERWGKQATCFYHSSIQHYHTLREVNNLLIDIVLVQLHADPPLFWHVEIIFMHIRLFKLWVLLGAAECVIVRRADILHTLQCRWAVWLI